MKDISDIINLQRYPISDLEGFATECHEKLKEHGSVVLPDFIGPHALKGIKEEAEEKKHLAFFSDKTHTPYLSPLDPDYPIDHPRNRQVVSTKGCITDDQVGENSALRILYDSKKFRQFLCTVLGESALFPYEDPLSSINVHYHKTGQELGWHFDNSSFAITLMIQSAESGGQVEYVKQLRNSEIGDMNFDGVGKVLDGITKPVQLAQTEGALVLFRGRDTIHRVTPNTGNRDRILVVLAYNTEPGISLSEEARLTFYGREM